MRKVRIKLPKAQSGLTWKLDHYGVINHSAFPNREMMGMEPQVEVNNILKPVEREEANVEAEKGETVVTNMNHDGIPEHYRITGKTHGSGGTPLNLPNNSFVFSKDKDLKISDELILKMFGKNMSGKGTKKYTPADIAKQYKINDYRKILADPSSNSIQIETAEMMIENYNKKLGALALVQESMKGFPDGIPALSQGFLDHSGIDVSSIFSMESTGDQAGIPAYKHGGQTGKRKVRVKYPKMQLGGQPPVFNQPPTQTEPPAGGSPSTTGKSTKVQNIPNDAIKWDQEASGYDETQIQPGDYIKKSDGKWYKATGYKTAPYTYNFQDPRLTGSGGDLQEAYGRLEQTMMDPNNEKLRADLIAKHRSNLKATKPNSKTGLTQQDIDQALALDDQQVISNFLEMQKQVFSVNASGIGGKGMDESDSWDKDRSNYEKTVTDLGFAPLAPWQQAAFQSTYIGLNDLSKDPAHKDMLSDFRMAQEGRDDENVSGLREGSISQVDGWVGNTTIGQGAIYKPVMKDLDIQEVPFEDVPAPEVAPTLDVDQPEIAPDAPWWLQDIVKTAGAAGDLARIKKYAPWQATPDYQLPDPTFFDPTRELAAIGEQANIAAGAISAFAGPQATSARLSGVQGQAAKNIADTLGRYNNLNVGVANQFELTRTQIQNQAANQRSNLATQLFDKNTIANQQFDNAKAMARQNLRQGYIDAITNRAQTQTLNELYPQYNVDPSTGGFMNFTQGRDIEPLAGGQASISNKFQELKNLNPGVKDEVIYKMAAAEMGTPDNSPMGIDPSFFANYAGGVGG